MGVALNGGDLSVGFINLELVEFFVCFVLLLFLVSFVSEGVS